ncbi:MAG: hypothetical protein VX730_08350 [Pseudomonadota bacterium]|nr:hypothetical protein [Pseudomonadota bacterium]
MRKLILAALAVLLTSISFASAEEDATSPAFERGFFSNNVEMIVQGMAQRSLPTEEMTFTEGLDFIASIAINLSILDHSLTTGKETSKFSYVQPDDGLRYYLQADLNRDEYRYYTPLYNVLETEGGVEQIRSVLRYDTVDTNRCHYISYQWEDYDPAAFVICENALNNPSNVVYYIQEVPVLQGLIDLID